MPCCLTYLTLISALHDIAGGIPLTRFEFGASALPDHL